MRLFERLYKSIKTKTQRHTSDYEIIQRNTEYMIKIEQLKELFTNSLIIYNSVHCQCSYPRFQQLISIDCSNYGKSFKCYDTDLLINLSKHHFNIVESSFKDEVTNEKWICKTCGSSYEYGWSDFSIYVERQKLKLIDLKTELIGLPSIKPVPLYLGLAGHSYPSKEEISNVTFDEFKKYMTEQ